MFAGLNSDVCGSMGGSLPDVTCCCDVLWFPSVSMRSTNCSSVGVVLARTSSLHSVLCPKVTNRGCGVCLIIVL